MNGLIQGSILSIMTSVFFGCSSGPIKKPKLLTQAEKAICDSMGIDNTIVLEIRKYNENNIEPFHYSLSKSIENGKETEIDPIHLNGLVFKESNSKSAQLVLTLKDLLRKKGYTIFLLDNNFNIDNQLDDIAVLKTTDQYTVLKQVATDAINYDINNDSLISIIKQFDSKYSLELIGASGDWCEFIIHKEPSNWTEFSKEVYKVCPDVVDQGTGTVESLAQEMQSTKRLYFWWD